MKSRAKRTIIENNVIAGLDGRDSRAIDVPDGGEVVIRGNVLEKGQSSANREMIGLALESARHAESEAVIEDNLIVFDTLPEGLLADLARAVGLLPAKGIVVRSRSPGPVVVQSNTIVGAREVAQGDVTLRGNRRYSSRSEAGLPPYPALPEAGR